MIGRPSTPDGSCGRPAGAAGAASLGRLRSRHSRRKVSSLCRTATASFVAIIGGLSRRSAASSCLSAGVVPCVIDFGGDREGAQPIDIQIAKPLAGTGPACGPRSRAPDPAHEAQTHGARRRQVDFKVIGRHPDGTHAAPVQKRTLDASSHDPIR
jgi:hypothetical protein